MSVLPVTVGPRVPHGRSTNSLLHGPTSACECTLWAMCEGVAQHPTSCARAGSHVASHTWDCSKTNLLVQQKQTSSQSSNLIY